MAILEASRPGLRSIIAPGWKWKSWRPSKNLKSKNREIYDWLSALGIPLLNDEPSLLLHGLGNLQNDRRMLKRIHKVFVNKKATFFVNTAGSGKTRHMLEALCREWGFYFSLSVDSDPMGSIDMQNCIDHRIVDTPGFTPELPEVDFEMLLAKNREISEDCIHQVLLARLLVFKLFLANIIDSGRRITEDDKRRWTLLQIRPALVGPSHDIFDELSQTLNTCGVDRHRCQLIGDVVLNQLRHLLSEHSERTGEPPTEAIVLYCVLDEAQLAAATLISAFRSAEDDLTPRSVLRQMITVLASFFLPRQFALTVAGTGVNKTLVDDAMRSAIGKTAKSRFRSGTGAFKEEKQSHSHEKYIRKYIPPQLLATADGERLVQRIKAWTVGRFRLTASFIAHLLKHIKNPNQVLDEWIHYNTGFTPTDATALTTFPRPTQTVFASPPLYLQLNFHQIVAHPSSKMLDLLATSIYQSLIRNNITATIHGQDDIFVECGFARFKDKACAAQRISEPLVVLAATDHIQKKNLGTQLKHHLNRKIGETTGNKCNGFESYVAFIFADAFGTPTPLTDVFKFPSGMVLPKWINQSARLVTVSLPSSTAPVNICNFDWPNSSVPSGHFGRDCKTPEETLGWLTHQFTTPFCFPSDNIGPDIFCVLQLEDKSLIWVVMQIKYWNNPTATTKQTRLPTDLDEDLRDGIRSTVPAKYWIQSTPAGKHHSHKKRPNLVPDTLAALKNLPGAAKTGTAYPILRVLVVFPTTVGIDKMVATKP
ncbi:hypothetical protein DFH09DRAFT_931293, partial [Mycena vulgaris]